MGEAISIGDCRTKRYIISFGFLPYRCCGLIQYDCSCPVAMLDARGELKQIDAGAYLELHIEQGPVLESTNTSTGVVLGTFGVERHMARSDRPRRRHFGISIDTHGWR